MRFPSEHWRQLHSTNPLERLNRELTRRCDVVGIFPHAAAVLRLVGALLEEVRTNGYLARRYFSQEPMGKLLPPPVEETMLAVSKTRRRGQLRGIRPRPYQADDGRASDRRPVFGPREAALCLMDP
jgi:hypothetical protein